MADRDEAGAMTILALALMVALVVIALGAASVVGVVVAHRTAQNAADLASLAAAAEASRGADGCAIAVDVVRAQQASLVSCAVEGTTVTLQVRVEPVLGPGVSARARAGPG
ncbi:MAG: Rv3654c family TadE-like protein [Marmoricola sp.]